MRRFQEIAIGGVWLVALCISARSFAQTPSAYHYYYFDQPVALQLDASRIALFHNPDTESNVASNDLVPFGILARDVTPAAIRGMAYARTPEMSADEEGVRELVRALAVNREAEFISPVFLDERGGPIVITRDILVGFVESVLMSRAEQTLVDWTDGQILDRNWLGMKAVYRVRCKSRNGFEVLAMANRLARRSDVRFAEPDMVLQSHGAVIPNDPLFPDQWALHNTGQTGGTPNVDIDGPEGWDSTSGAPSIIVVILDDGIQQDHPDINQIPGRDFTDRGTDGGPSNLCDRHGTAVAGCVAAVIDNGIGVVGIAPRCTVASAKWTIANTSCNGGGSFMESWLVNAIAWSETIGARVTNNSYGLPQLSAVTTIYNDTRGAGVIHFAAAGNTGTDQIDYPASISSVHAVAALDHNGAPAFFTNSGSGLAYIAPGESILTTDLTGLDGFDEGDYAIVDGTSFASPYAAGVAALVISVDPTQTVEKVDQVMRDTAVDLGAQGHDTTYGWGLVNAAAAVAVPQAPNTTCAAAHPVMCNSAVSFGNANRSEIPEPPLSCGEGGEHIGALWFSFTATSVSARIATCDSGAPDTTLAVYEGQCGQLVEIACNETGDCESSPDRASLCVAGLTIGETYYVQVASPTPETRGLIFLQIACSCPAACCLLPPLEACRNLQSDDCAALGGESAAPGTHCLGDGNLSGFDNACESVVVNIDQFPADGESGIASNIDWTDRTPNRIVADDYISEGLPTRSIQWWGSDLGRNIEPDGWMISFHEIPTPSGPAALSIGQYFCSIDAVSSTPVALTSCDEFDVNAYEVALRDCCLMHAGSDSRVDDGSIPAQSDGFFEESCQPYRLAIQAIIGRRFDDDGDGGCAESSTGRNVSGHYWGWLSASADTTTDAFVESSAFPSSGDWFYLPWSTTTPSCGSSNLAFKIESSKPVLTQDVGLWGNGVPGGRDALFSQYGGELSDGMSVDDFVLGERESITDVIWTNEEESQFVWAQRVRLEFYADDGAGGPDATNGPVAALWVPDDGGRVTRQPAGTGTFNHQYAYAISGIDVPLDAGTWWLGVATAGEENTDGFAFWSISHTYPIDETLFGSAAHFRAPSLQTSAFRPWGDLLARPNDYDMSFTLRSVPTLDCNCNGAPDADDLSDVEGLIAYDITLQDLVELSTDCGNGSIYNACTKRKPGFAWTDTGGGKAVDVRVEFNIGVDCHAVGTAHQTRLNGVWGETYASVSRHCACLLTGGSAIVVSADPEDYSVGDVNTFAISNPSTCMGLIPRTEWGEGIYARVTVSYERASQDCNGNEIPDECDIADGVSVDLFGVGGTPDGIPDDCQTDCNANGQPDDLDIAEGESLDVIGPGATADGIPDECQSDCTGNLVPDLLDIADGTSSDCNENSVPDECDIAAGVSEDTFGVNGTDGIPDECQPDCNQNNLPDDYDIQQGISDDCNENDIPDSCDLSQQDSSDCQPNGVPDECDISVGDATDNNENGVPDVCECQTEAPQADAGVMTMARYIAFAPGDAGHLSAIRIRSVTLHAPDPPNAPQFPPPDFSKLEGTTMWIQTAIQVTDSASLQTTFTVADTGCEPQCMDFGSLDLLYVFGADIVPSSQYEVQAIRCDCDFADESGYSDPLMVSTARWGDVVEPFSGSNGSSQPDFSDISALVVKFQDGIGAVSKARAQLQPNIPDPTMAIDFQDIAAGIDAFGGVAYPFSGPCVCPSAVLCGATSCTNDTECVEGLCVENYCTDACGRCTQ